MFSLSSKEHANHTELEQLFRCYLPHIGEYACRTNHWPNSACACCICTNLYEMYPQTVPIRHCNAMSVTPGQGRCILCPASGTPNPCLCVQDKINAFWEISKKELEDTKAQLRNKDREMEELEERHQVEIKVAPFLALALCLPTFASPTSASPPLFLPPPPPLCLSSPFSAPPPVPSLPLSASPPASPRYLPPPLPPRPSTSPSAFPPSSAPPPPPLPFPSASPPPLLPLCLWCAHPPKCWQLATLHIKPAFCTIKADALPSGPSVVRMNSMPAVVLCPSLHEIHRLHEIQCPMRSIACGARMARYIAAVSHAAQSRSTLQKLKRHPNSSSGRHNEPPHRVAPTSDLHSTDRYDRHIMHPAIARFGSAVNIAIRSWAGAPFTMHGCTILSICKLASSHLATK